MFLRYASISSMGARATAAYVRSWFSRCTSRPSRWSTSNAQPTQLFFWPGPIMKCFRKSWLRPLNSCASVTFPAGPSKTYSFSTRTQGNARCSALSWSRNFVNAFSLASKAVRAVRHSLRETTRCASAVFVAVPVSVCDIALGLAAWLSLMFHPPCDSYLGNNRGGVLVAKFFNHDRNPGAGRSGADGGLRCGCDANRAHFILLPRKNRMLPCPDDELAPVRA